MEFRLVRAGALRHVQQQQQQQVHQHYAQQWIRSAHTRLPGAAVMASKRITPAVSSTPLVSQPIREEEMLLKQDLQGLSYDISQQRRLHSNTAAVYNKIFRLRYNNVVHAEDADNEDPWVSRIHRRFSSSSPLPLNESAANATNSSNSPRPEGRESEGSGARFTSRGARGSGLPAALRRRERSSHDLKQRLLGDRYEVKNLIGRGGFGLVRLGKDRKNRNRCVALKCINKTADHKVLQTELAVLRRLMDIEKTDELARKLFTVPVELIELEDQYVVVFEYLGGGDLFDRIVHLGHVSEQDLKPVMFQIAESLAHLHQNGIIHRDVKPENILFRVTCRPDTEIDQISLGIDQMLPWDVIEPVLCDFGLSYMKGKEDLIDPPAGTFGYASPQVLKMEENIDASCDMWSYGVMMFAALGGELPFPASTDGSTLMEEHLREAYRGPRFLSNRWHTISNDAKSLISDLLHYSPFNRPTAHDVLKHAWFQDM